MTKRCAHTVPDQKRIEENNEKKVEKVAQPVLSTQQKKFVSGEHLD